MGFFAPLFALSAALVAIPWLVHRIRRPERETVRFSSLMFVPDIKREVIERRRIQHVLLMLLRMGLLLALALAFARPFADMLLSPEASTLEKTDHVIVMDASLSMASDGVWESAKMQAESVLQKVVPGDRVGFIHFAQTPVVDVLISNDVELVRQAIDGVEVTWAHADYVAALQAAEQMLTADTAQVHRVIHLISDFQASGMPASDTGWRLPGTIKLNANEVIAKPGANASIDALAIRAVKDDALQIRARVRNWSGRGALAVQLVMDGKVVETRDVTVSQGNATQVGFSVPPSVGVEGYVAVVGGDALDRDDRRFFVRHAKPQHPIQVLDEVGATRKMLEAAVPDNAGLPWRLMSAKDLTGSVVVADDVDGLDAMALRTYVEKGGALFLPLRKDADARGLNAFFAQMGVGVSGIADAGYAELAWVNLDHRIFHPFKGARFNDFSSIRYDNYHTLDVDSSAVVLAKFDDDTPAIVEVLLGDGRILIWAGGMGLDRTNLPRTSRFVPMLHETLRYLAGEQEVEIDYVVGAAVRVSGAVKRIAGADLSDGKNKKDLRHFSGPGVYQWGDDAQVQKIAVNVVDKESDPARVTPAEFEIRLCDAPVLFQKDGEQRSSSDLSVQYEYGHWAIGLLFVLLLVEHFYASWLGARGEKA